MVVLEIKKAPDQDSLIGAFLLQTRRGLKGGGRNFDCRFTRSIINPGTYLPYNLLSICFRRAFLSFGFLLRHQWK